MEWCPDKGRVFTEADWSDLNARGISPYYRSKVSPSVVSMQFCIRLVELEELGEFN